MESIKPPKYIKVYTLVKQTGMYFTNTGSSGTQSIGLGYYTNLQEAEFNRTTELLKADATKKEKFHIFELDVPNPAYEEEVIDARKF